MKPAADRRHRGDAGEEPCPGALRQHHGDEQQIRRHRQEQALQVAEARQHPDGTARAGALHCPVVEASEEMALPPRRRRGAVVGHVGYV